MGLAHLTGRVNMGDRSLHSHLRADGRQFIETDEEGKEVIGDDGKPKRRFVRPFIRLKDFKCPARNNYSYGEVFAYLYRRLQS